MFPQLLKAVNMEHLSPLVMKLVGTEVSKSLGSQQYQHTVQWGHSSTNTQCSGVTAVPTHSAVGSQQYQPTVQWGHNTQCKAYNLDNQS